MATLAITNGFEKSSDAELETRSYQIHTGVTDNPGYFPTPTPSVVDMGDIIANFFQALNDCKEGDRYKIAIKNQKRQALINALHLWSAYVLSQAAGDPIVALASNFTLRKVSAPRPPITKPENFRVAAGVNPLEMAGRINRVEGAMGYIFQYAKDEMMALDNWQGTPSTTTKCIIANLESGVVYNWRVLAIGSKKQVMTSDVLRCRVA